MANKIYTPLETAITWNDTGTTTTFTLNNLAASAGRQGDLYDLGTASAARLFRWRAWFQSAGSPPVVGEVVRVYIKTSDGTTPDNDDIATDVALSNEDKLRNLMRLPSIQIDEAVNTVTFARSGIVFVPERWVGPVFFNDTAANLKATNDVSGFSLTPIPFEVQ